MFRRVQAPLAWFSSIEKAKVAERSLKLKNIKRDVRFAYYQLN
jgi:hypothetical protein